MLRIIGVIIFVIGLLLVCLGVAKILPGATGAGGFGAFVGIVVFGLSFIRRPVPGPDAPPPLSPVERITGVFFEPARIFQNLRYHPRWLAGFLVIAIFSAIYHVAFVQRLTPEVIALAPIEKLIESGWIQADRADETREKTRDDAKTPIARFTGPLLEIGGIFLFMVFLAAILLLFALIFGGRINFWQALCVAVYATLPPFVIEKFLSVILLYLKSPDDIDPIKGKHGLVRADLSILFSPADHPYLYVLGGFLGLLSLYGLWLEATGLRHTGEKISSASAWTIALILWGISLIFWLVVAALFPTFVT
jgi:Yip1-like protein